MNIILNENQHIIIFLFGKQMGNVYVVGIKDFDENMHSLVWQHLGSVARKVEICGHPQPPTHNTVQEFEIFVRRGIYKTDAVDAHC